MVFESFVLQILAARVLVVPVLVCAAWVELAPSVEVSETTLLSERLLRGVYAPSVDHYGLALVV